MTTCIVLCVNAGSSTLKLALFEVDPDRGATGERELWRSHLETDPATTPNLTPALAELERLGLPAPTAIGHRVVHGGADHIAPELIDGELLDDLDDLVRFAPLHQPAALAGIRVTLGALPGTPQVACFDTAFHHTLDPAARVLALPASVRARGVRRYGFHGLSFEYVVDQLGPSGHVVIAHLGAGASLCAVVDGRSIDTTMGLTPTGGLVMATRSGDLDPGVVLELLGHHSDGDRRSADLVAELLDHQAGLVGLSGTTGDIRELLARRDDGDQDAALAVAVFCRTVRKQVAAMAAAMGRIDSLVFTGGIGENAPIIRSEICADLGFLGIALDPSANETGEHVISTSSEGASGVTVRVVPTDEERMIARHVAAVVHP